MYRSRVRRATQGDQKAQRQNRTHRFSPIDRRACLGKAQVAPSQQNSGFTISHIGGITGAGCLLHYGEAILRPGPAPARNLPARRPRSGGALLNGREVHWAGALRRGGQSIRISSPGAELEVPHGGAGLARLWHNAEIPRCPLSRRYQGHSGRQTASPDFMSRRPRKRLLLSIDHFFKQLIAVCPSLTSFDLATRSPKIIWYGRDRHRARNMPRFRAPAGKSATPCRRALRSGQSRAPFSCRHSDPPRLQGRVLRQAVFPKVPCDRPTFAAT
jgi:hypothetical protein